MAAFGAAFATSVSAAQDHSSAGPADARWQPARHSNDDWFDQLPGVHRFFIDSVSADGFGEALLFANNYFSANKNSYGLEERSLAVIVCARHQSTAFAFTDAMWAKYGAGLAERARFTDPQTGKPPIVNVYQATGYGTAIRGNGVTLTSVLGRGMHLAVCQLATRAAAATIARQTGAKPDDVYQELASNLVPNAHIVPAGIIAVNRAQERGYSFAYAG